VIVFSTILAIICDFSGINPTKALFWSAIVNGVLAPFLLFAVLLVIRDKVLMKGQPSSKLNQSFVMLSMILMFGALIGMFIFS
jgi:Mn2+/Fe2+ NRAMP family transporter